MYVMNLISEFLLGHVSVTSYHTGTYSSLLPYIQSKCSTSYHLRLFELDDKSHSYHS